MAKLVEELDVVLETESREDFEKRIKQEIKDEISSKVVNTPQRVIQQEGKSSIMDLIEDLQNWDLKDRTYILCDDLKPVNRMIQAKTSPQRALQWIDKKTGTPHAIRWSTNQPSFFIEEQSKVAAEVIEQEICLLFGTLTVPRTQSLLQKLLYIHPDNVINGGSIFEEYDPEKKSKEFVNKEKKKVLCYKKIAQLDTSEIRSIVSVASEMYAPSWKNGECEAEMYKLIAEDANAFYVHMIHPLAKTKGLVKESLLNGRLVWKNYQFYDSKDELVLTIPANVKDEIEFMADFLTTSEGRVLNDHLKG